MYQVDRESEKLVLAVEETGIFMQVYSSNQPEQIEDSAHICTTAQIQLYGMRVIHIHTPMAFRLIAKPVLLLRQLPI